MFLTLVTWHTIQNALTMNVFLVSVPWETSNAMPYWTLDALFMPALKTLLRKSFIKNPFQNPGLLGLMMARFQQPPTWSRLECPLPMVFIKEISSCL